MPSLVHVANTSLAPTTTGTPSWTLKSLKLSICFTTAWSLNIYVAKLRLAKKALLIFSSTVTSQKNKLLVHWVRNLVYGVPSASTTNGHRTTAEKFKLVLVDLSFSVRSPVLTSLSGLCVETVTRFKTRNWNSKPEIRSARRSWTNGRLWTSTAPKDSPIKILNTWLPSTPTPTSKKQSL